MQIGEFIDALPKAELHLHLEGAIPWEMVRADAAVPPFLPSWAPGYRFESFSEFARVLRGCYEPVLTDPSRYHTAAAGIFRDLVAQRVRYVELSYSLGHALSRGLPQDQIVDAIKQAAPPDLTVRVFCGFSRSRPALAREEIFAAVVDLPGLDGVDLHGDENAQGPEAFAPLFAEADRRGLMVKAHAGELAGPLSMWNTIDTLRLHRIEHGVTAAADEQLLARLLDEVVTLDMCPTSNVKLGVISDAGAHPIGRLHRRGIRVTVSTDNPTVLGCRLTDELHLLVGALGFSTRDLVQVQRNAFQAARLPEVARTAILAELDALLARAVPGAKSHDGTVFN